MNQEEDI